MFERFGEAYRFYAAWLPRWLPIVLALCVIPRAVTAQTESAAPAVQPDATPAVVAKIRFEPGARARWIETFERHIAPAILEAIETGDEIIDVSYYESVIPGQDYDFLLVFRAKSFAFYDGRRVFPHYAALFRRVGVEEGRRIIEEMAEWEASVTVTLLRSYGVGP
ncbi:MAG: hypothetical protein JSV86_13310 [Gemmatimonadota bacterium]|nr:MAG: hypothetical protein JSV86_13310 [Gemmatimonadota bacterium]